MASLVMQRRRLVVRGVVQGVGFRPFVAGLARRLGLSGHVRNVSGAVVIEIEGAEAALGAFGDALTRERPSLAAIDAIDVAEIDEVGDRAFVIDASVSVNGRRASIPADIATCAACLRELHDPRDRRYRYPFLNCTQCGPRFTIITDLPYDRAATTMAAFPMCDACRREYEDVADRRYHAEPIACPECGPRVWCQGANPATGNRQPATGENSDPGTGYGPSATGKTSGAEGPDASAIDTARAWLDAGWIVAVKGLGGFHLACDARNEAAVATLRARKGRGDKPFALMVGTIAQARALCAVSDDEAAVLDDRARPVVLLTRRDPSGDGIASLVAPGQDSLGVMLPYSPLHQLLVAGGPLVMTSGNRSDEPIARTNREALEALSAIADGFLMHDREIHAVCDDSVVRVFRGRPLPIRRSRGFAPLPVHLASGVAPVLAVGGELKSTFCLAHETDAYLSQHLGDLESVETLDAFDRAVHHLLSLFAITPEMIAIDPHPAYLSSRWAREWAAQRRIPVVAVHHHHAHHASLMAEHRLAPDATMLGVVFDGTGYGEDGTVWGGEFLVGGCAGVTRVAHLAPTPLPAGDVDVRHASRLALAHLAAAGLPWDDDLPCVRASTPLERQILARRLERGLGLVKSSSMGRLFDAVSSLLGVRHVSSYEADAAIRLEAVARTAGPVEDAEPWAFGLHGVAGVIHLDPAPLWHGLVGGMRAGVATSLLAARFHDAVARAVLAVAARTRDHRGIETVGLSGGVFQNVLLLERTVTLLEHDGFRVLTHQLVPPNDGGLSLGQAVVASCHMSR
jgi:hydrogenase maturation protein HypF